MKRIVSIWLPTLPLDRFFQEARLTKAADASPLREGSPLALIAKANNGIEVFACNRAAEDGGVTTGMKLKHAKALLPALITRPAAPQKDARHLTKLAEWCQRYTPVTALDGQDGLMLDITGAAHLLGSEINLLRDLERRLKNLGFKNRLGLAGTPSAAWGLARFAPSQPQTPPHLHIGPHDDAAEKLQAFPIEALRLEAETANMLRRFGLKTIGQLFQLPRHSLARRFNSKEQSAAVLKRLDQLLGALPEPLNPLTPPPLYYERLNFADPILQTESFLSALDALLSRLCTRLEKAHKGARSLTFSAYRADGGVSHISIQAARPSRDPVHFAHLFRGKIETINPSFGVDVVILSTHLVEALSVRQGALGGEQKYGRLTLGALVDRLSNRLGPHAVTRKAPVESHLPECAQRAVPPLSSVRWHEPHKPARPLRLFARPEPIEVIAALPDGPPRMFRWRRVLRRIVKASGPERIAPEWWRDLSRQSRTRDYYTLEDDKGQRYWLFREGLYEGEEDTCPPYWRMHGVFA